MKKILWLIPLMMVLMMVGAMAAFDITWTCPVTGTSTNTVVKDYLTYEDDAPYALCTKAGNNFTIEFAVTGAAADWSIDTGASADNQTQLNATLYIYSGNKEKYVLPISGGNITNTSATSSDLVRFTDFGELYTTGIVGKPKWYNNLTQGGYKWYIELYNTTDDATGEQILSSEKGMNSGGPVRFTIDHRGSTALKTAAAYQAGAEGTDDLQSVFGPLGLDGPRDKAQGILLIVIIGIGIWYLFLRNQ